MAYAPRSYLVVMPAFSAGIAYFWSCDVEANMRAARWLVDNFTACCAGLFPPELRPGRGYPASLDCNLMLSRFLFVANLALGGLYLLSAAGSVLLGQRAPAPGPSRRWIAVAWALLWVVACLAALALFFRLYFQQRAIADAETMLFLARVSATKWSAMIDIAYSLGFFLSAIGAVLWLGRAIERSRPAT
jgi:hypothetical protein